MPRSTTNPTEDIDPPHEASLQDAVDEVVRAIAHAPPRPPPADPERGTRWGDKGRYIIERRLGRGGMGTVYLATDALLGRQVALKVLDAGESVEEDQRRARLLREARLAAGIEHERVARIYDVGEHDGSTFVAMEYVRGATLRAWMGEARPPAKVLEVITQIAEGLAALHERGVVHRDLKPENVMLRENGTIKLLDFGLAGHVTLPPEVVMTVDVTTRTSEGGHSSAFLGTPGYMAPEQYLGQRADSRADVFALGVVIFELVAGERPFKGATMPALFKAALEHPRILDGARWRSFPPPLAAAARRMLEPEKDLRFSNGAETLQALRALDTVVAIPGASTPPRRRFPARSVAAVVLLAAAAGSVLFLGPRVQRARALRAALSAPPPGMVLVPGGRVRLGASEADVAAACTEIGAACDRERLGWSVPPRVLEVSPFFLDRVEVSNVEMADMLNDIRASLVVAPDEDTHTPRYVRFNAGLGHDAEPLMDLFDATTGIVFTPSSDPAAKAYEVRPERTRWPVTQVTLFGARRFCASRGKRLPTEDEWETAARGLDNRKYPWGNAPARCGGVHVAPDGNIESEPGCPATPMPTDVGTSPQDVTPEGVFDLGGNVGEWVDTVFTAGPAPSGSDDDALLRRVTRGGSFAIALAARTFVRSRQQPLGAGINGGFRCARSVSLP